MAAVDRKVDDVLGQGLEPGVEIAARAGIEAAAPVAGRVAQAVEDMADAPVVGLSQIFTDSHSSGRNQIHTPTASSSSGIVACSHSGS